MTSRFKNLLFSIVFIFYFIFCSYGAYTPNQKIDAANIYGILNITNIDLGTGCDVFGNGIWHNGQTITNSGNIFNGSFFGNAYSLSNLYTCPVVSPSITNMTLNFNGGLQLMVVTNQDVWFNFTGSNGCISILCHTNISLHTTNGFRWLNGTAKNFITNGIMSFTSYGPSTNNIVGSLVESD